MRERKVYQNKIAIARLPTVLKTSELGSCIAIALFDQERKIGALSHVLLPKHDTLNKRTSDNDGKFADLAVKRMVLKMQHAGCDLKHIRAKIAGGAKFFQSRNTGCRNKSSGSIGSENVKMARTILQEYGIPIVALDVGGDYCRRIQFFSHTGKLIVETTKNGKKEL